MDGTGFQKTATNISPWELPIELTPDHSWLHIETGFNLAREHEIESLQAVSNGYVGTRGALAEGSPLSAPATFVAGIFDRTSALDSIPSLVVAPDWMNLRGEVDGVEFSLLNDSLEHNRRILDMRQGILWRDWIRTDPSGRQTRIWGFRLCSLAERHVLYQTVVLTPLNYSGRLRVESRIDRRINPKLKHGPELTPAETEKLHFRPDGPETRTLVLQTVSTDLKVAFAAVSDICMEEPSPVQTSFELSPGKINEIAELDIRQGKTYRLERIMTVYTSRDSDDPVKDAAQHTETISIGNRTDLILRHTEAWQKRWQCADIEIDGDDFLQTATRHAIYHLIGACDPEDTGVSIAAKGLTGGGYRGHYFWDTEVFMVPFYIFTHPPAARALLTFRSHTLEAAKRRAKEMGYAGALFAWESTTSGEDVTPMRALAPDGTIIPVVSGWQEQHISADVAYAVAQYHRMTGDDAFLIEHGARIIFETARFWADRFRVGSDGLYHINGVQGPDEYHEDGDDSAFTNWMGAENLRLGLWANDYLKGLNVSDASAPTAVEGKVWADTARRIYTGVMDDGVRIEQQRGFFELDDIDVYEYGDRVLPLDILLGRERTQRTQVVKQADVVMLLYMLWDRFTPQQRAENFYYYERRTGHGSSLSPSIHALMAARLGDMPMAMRYLSQASRIDLANNMGNAAGGMHMAALGGLWQALVFGFGGVHPQADGLVLDPHIPEMWKRFVFHLEWRGTKLRFGFEGPHRLTVAAKGSTPVPLSLQENAHLLEPGGTAAIKLGKSGRWSNWEKVSS